MAIDEYLIKYYEKTKRPVLRFYGWSPAAISVGKYQSVINDINIEACTDDDMCVVRRITGGGGILHEDELTYSIVCSEEDIGCRNMEVKKAFEKLNGFILNFYRGYGLKPAYAVEVLKKTVFGGAAPFCYTGHEEYDIVVKGKKIGGNAQMRKKNIIFQHGSIPLSGAKEKPLKYFNAGINTEGFTTLCAEAKKHIEPAEASLRLLDVFKATFKVKVKEEKFLEKEKEAVDRLVIEKYSSDEWNLKGGKDALRA